MRNPKRTRTRTVLGTAIATALLLGTIIVGATSMAAVPAECGPSSATTDGGTRATDCSEDAAEKRTFGCVHIDPWTVPPDWDIHWEHCLQKVSEPVDL